MSNLRAFLAKLKAPIGWFLLGSILIGSLGYVFLKALYLIKPKPNEYTIVSNTEISNALVSSNDPSTNVLAAGAVVDINGEAVKGATVKLSAYTTDGQLIWSTNSQTNECGIFTFRENAIPPVKDIYGAVLTAEAPGYLADKKNVTVRELTKQPTTNQNPQPQNPQPQNPQPQNPQLTPSREIKTIEITPKLNLIPLTPYNSWLTIIVMLPAIFGLLFAILHLKRFSLGIEVSYWYAFGTAALWSAVVAELIGVYVARGYALIPLFWPDLFVSSGVIIFAFLGSIVYVAFSMHEKAKTSFFDCDTATKRKILLTLGGRVLVAPYIALTAYGIMAATFPTIRTGPFAAFFGFFTGLWIKVVLEMLNDIGTRFLSAESAQKVADLMKRTEAPDAPSMPTSSAISLKPDQAFLDAVAEARRELLQKDNVIGVASGFKLDNSNNSEVSNAILVYVYEKQNLPEGDPNRVPETFRGFPTDVISFPSADPSKECRESALDISWEKVNADHVKQLEEPDVAHDEVIDRHEQVLILVNRSLFFRGVFDAKLAYELVQPRLGTQFDFVAFFIDRASGLPDAGNYNITVVNDVKGINHPLGDSYSKREEWGTPQLRPERLRACQVHSPDRNGVITQRVLLHELAHSWCAYATFKDPNGPDHSMALLRGSAGEGMKHWGRNFDNERSCMDSDLSEWVANPDGTFTKADIDDKDFAYCELDLYLMGLLSSDQVKPMRILINPRQDDPGRPIFRSTVKTVTIEQIITSCGATVPLAASTTFRQAFVVVSANRESGMRFASTVNNWRIKHEQNFAAATRVGKLITSIG